MKFDWRALAAKAQGWVSYGLGKVASGLKLAWAKLSVAGNYVVDPPPTTLRRLFWIALPVVMGLVIYGASIGWRLNQTFDPGPIRMSPVMAFPKLPDVITTVPPAVVPEARKESVTVIPVKPDEKVVPVPAPKAAAKKRKAKAAEVSKPVAGF